jgi:serine/threonine-protein kinase
MSSPGVPQWIGKYELGEYLGGGMSAVYRARDTLMSRTVAVKVLKEAHLDQPAAQRFLLEAQIAGNLNHENVVRTYDFGFDPDGRPFMVLEYLEGENLGDAIKGQRTGSLRHRARIGAELSAALEYIHARDVVHRDLKPANVFLSNATGGGPLVKLMDFGIARLKDVSITQTGMTLGTPGYMAPEQVRGEPVLKSVDIYAFGIVLWELFTGERAFSAATLERVFYMVLNQPIELDRLRAAGVPEELTNQIGKCTSKEAWKRPEDLQAIRTELLSLSAGSMSAVVRPSQVPTMVIPAGASATAAARETATAPEPANIPNKPDRRLVWASAAVLGLLTVLAVLLLSRGTSGKQPPPPPPEVSAGLAQRVETPSGTMLLVPSGAFQFGEAKESVDLPAFYVDRTEVSNRAFAEFARATGSTLPPGFAAGEPDLPVVNVTLAEAQAFATWAGKWLPTSKQWEKAARGVDGRSYPWGEGADASRANVGAGKSGALSPVGGFVSGASPFQAVQMVGNAWEWVDETAAPSPQASANFARALTPPPAAGERWVRIRGGSYYEPLDPKVMWESFVVPVRYRSPLVGFRCVKRAE